MMVYRAGYSVTTMTVFVFLSILYVFSISIEGLIREDYFKLEVRDKMTYIKVIFTMFIAIGAFWAGYVLSGLKEVERRMVVRNDRKNSIVRPNGEMFLVFASIALVIGGFFIFRDLFYASISSYTENVFVTFDNSTYAFFKAMSYSLLAISSGICFQNRKWNLLGIILVGVLFLMGVLTSDKDPIVLSILALVTSFGWIYQKKFSVKKYIYLFLLLVFVAYLSKVFSYYRGTNEFVNGFAYAFYNFSFSNLDGGGPFYSIIKSIEARSDYLYGESYLNTLLNLIPKFLYSGERPPDIAVQFAMKEMIGWSGGRGLGISPLAEGQMNLGTLGVALQFFLVSLIWGYIWITIKRTLSVIGNIDSKMFLVIYRIVGFYLILLLFRSPALFFLKSIMHVFLPIVAILLIYNTLVKAKMGSR